MFKRIWDCAQNNTKQHDTLIPTHIGQCIYSSKVKQEVDCQFNTATWFESLTFLFFSITELSFLRGKSLADILARPILTVKNDWKIREIYPYYKMYCKVESFSLWCDALSSCYTYQRRSWNSFPSPVSALDPRPMTGKTYDSRLKTQSPNLLKK